MNAKNISRAGDMAGGNKLDLFFEDDGDVIVQVMPWNDVLGFESVQFCMSGTMSPNTTRALHRLSEAMREDEARQPHQLHLQPTDRESERFNKSHSSGGHSYIETLLERIKKLEEEVARKA